MNAAFRQRREDVERAFSHIAGLAASADYTGATEPLQQWVVALRRIMKYYGDIGERPSIADVRFTPGSAGGVRAEWVQASGASDADRIVYIHGGGWSGGTPEDARGLTALLARRSGASILVPEYRKAPEHRFPAGLDDSAAAFVWAREHGPTGAGEARTLALLGDSSGGNIAVALSADLIKRGKRPPDRLALIAPLLDNLAGGKRAAIDDPICPPEGLASGLAVYLGDGGGSAEDPRVSPLYEADEVLAKFPPTLIQASNIEALLYDSRRFAERLEKNDVRVALSVWPGLPHVWQSFVGLLPEAAEALAEIADFVRPQRD